MARVLVGTVGGLPFYADDSEGLTEGVAEQLHGGGVAGQAAELSTHGCTATKAQLRTDGRVFVYPDEQMDDPRILTFRGIS